MLSRFVLVLMVLSLVIAVVGCEGDTGPAGPAGADGADGAGVLAWAEVDGSPTGDVTNKWPGNVAIGSTRNSTGDYTVDLTGSFPNADGVVVAGIANGSGNVAVSSAITAWSTNAISIDVSAWNTGTDTAVDVQFTVVVFEGD